MSAVDYAAPGHPDAADSAPLVVAAHPDQATVTLDLTQTGLLGALAVALVDAGVLATLDTIGRCGPCSTLGMAALADLRRHPGITAALTLTLTAGDADETGCRLVDAAEVAGSGDCQLHEGWTHPLTTSCAQALADASAAFSMAVAS